MIFQFYRLSSGLKESFLSKNKNLQHFSSRFEDSSSLGITLNGGSLDVSVFSSAASRMSLQLFLPRGTKKLKETSLEKDGSGIWRGDIKAEDPDLEYLFIVDGKPVIDPYAKALTTPREWGKWEHPIRCNFTWDHSFSWEGVKKPTIKREELIIYEMHVRGFTVSPSSGSQHPGTFLGIIEKIPYLKQLGINAVELMPIFEFDERGHNANPGLWNYWGYTPINFFSPMRRYAAENRRLAPIDEFKLMVRELHRAGIQVILDVVYNHVDVQSNLNELDRKNYFILDQFFQHTNYTGCGNTINANAPFTKDLILASLCYFANECQVDGFRFDLAAALARGPSGEYLFSPPLFQDIERDPTLSQTHLIGEPWDCSTLHLQGKFPCKLLSEWNAFFRDDVRKFVRGDPFVEQTYLEHLLGCSYITKERKKPSLFVNYIASHDGFSAQDLVSYNHKHNEMNGENSEDGDDFSLSCNYGVEGKTEDLNILHTRRLQRENLLFSAIFCRGVSMLKMGDEYGHSHEGNNNPYCIDSPINWFNWEEMGKNREFVSRIEQWIVCKKQIDFFFEDRILNPEEIHWIETQSGFAACIAANAYLFAMNMSLEEKNLPLPRHEWKILATTGDYLEIPEKILPKTSLIACRS